MNLRSRSLIFLVVILLAPQLSADYKLGCDDPDYDQYMASRFAHFTSSSSRLYSQTLTEYKSSFENNTNPFRAISDLSRHLKYSAQFDPVDVVQTNIERLLAHGDELRVDQKVAVSIFDGFSDEDHAIAIARAWIAYRQGDTKTAFSEMLASIDGADSATLSSFGPDIYFIRHILRDGYTEPVLNYLKLSEQFWLGENPDNMRYIWRTMINNNCAVAFESFDAIKALELGIQVRDIFRPR